MIGLGLRLTIAGGREAIARLTLIAIAVAMGVGLLLTSIAALSAVNTQNTRYAWLESTSSIPAADRGSAPAHDLLWWRLRADYYRGTLVGRVDLAATGPTSPVPPGISRLPGPGQYYASPAMARLLRHTPAAELGARYPGTLVGTIGPAGLPGPGSRIIVIGHRTSDVSARSGFDRIRTISTIAPSQCNANCLPGVGIDGDGLTLVLAVVAAALLFPVLIFIGSATRLSAARREQRFAALRLIGATPRQISVIAALESAAAAAIGTLLGFSLFYALRPVSAKVPFTGQPFFTTDLVLSPGDIALVAVGVPLAAAVAARIALRRVNISPLGVTRRVTPRPPRARRVIPVLAGVGWLAYLAYVSDIGNSHEHSADAQALAYLLGVLMVMTGLVVAGPWMTLLGSRLMARRARRATTLIASRRLADNPQAGFRAVSGLVLALFVGTCSVGIITTLLDYNTGGSAAVSRSYRGTLVEQFENQVAPAPTRTTIPAATMSTLSSIPGVTGETELRISRPSDAHHDEQTVAMCSQLVRTPVLGRCPSRAQVVFANPDYEGGTVTKSTMSATTWPKADLTCAQAQALPIDSIFITTDGSSATVERARTVVTLAYPAFAGPQTIPEIQSDNARQIRSYQRLADVMILTSLPIAGCSLAVSVVAGLSDRRRPFSLLRLTGAPLRTLRRVIALEAAGPLLVSMLVTAGVGFLTASLFLRAQLHETIKAPGSTYYLLVLAGLVGSTAVIASVIPLLNRMTGPDIARND